ncbi:Aste57867_18470 [Aphanomyces stellatus]|uniref:Aste57867_18470 protein n=1 Tax=Aphanomyces stellatus TaxID=120398 RepID=A0A485LDY4_9STRA|nr:hypothetical protein As57867_018408 [Aphanomyces stellatus]VFT95206.1 Aste57867_18470 [Aphanomyces stellatus]
MHLIVLGLAAACAAVAKAGPCPDSALRVCVGAGGRSTCYFYARQGCCNGVVFDNIIKLNTTTGALVNQTCCANSSDAKPAICQSVQVTSPPSTPPPPQVSNALQPTITPTAPQTASSSLSTGAMIGIAVCAVVTLALLAFVGHRWRRQQRRPRPIDIEFEMYNLMHDEPAKVIQLRSSITGGPPSMDGSALQWHNLELVRVDAEQVELTLHLGSGASGEIWFGRYDGTTPVAVKKLKKQSLPAIQLFIDEIARLASFDCPFIVGFVGASWIDSHPSSLQAVLEYMDMGDLRAFLDRTRLSDVMWSTKLAWACDIIDGLVYLHSLHLVHRDLKSRNILLDTTKPAKLADFGISKEVFDETMTLGIGTYRWMAPEMLGDKHYTNAVDVYSFGVVLSELETHNVPYANVLNDRGAPISDMGVAALVMEEKLRPSLSRLCPPWFEDLARQCMAQDPTQRPTAIQLAFILRTRLREEAFELPPIVLDGLEMSSSGYLT